jgi:hypothetical protein
VARPGKGHQDDKEIVALRRDDGARNCVVWSRDSRARGAQPNRPRPADDLEPRRTNARPRRPYLGAPDPVTEIVAKSLNWQMRALLPSSRLRWKPDLLRHLPLFLRNALPRPRRRRPCGATCEVGQGSVREPAPRSQAEPRRSLRPPHLPVFAFGARSYGSIASILKHGLAGPTARGSHRKARRAGTATSAAVATTTEDRRKRC